MNPLMMMMLPQLMGQDSSKQNPMNMMVMAMMMKSSNEGSDYDYDYGYDYDDSSDYDYDYEDDSQGPPSPSPLSAIIQQMMQQKLAARTPVVVLNAKPAESTTVVEVATSDDSKPIEVAQSRPQDKGVPPSEQVSYRSAP